MRMLRFAFALLLLFALNAEAQNKNVRFRSSRPGVVGDTCNLGSWPDVYLIGVWDGSGFTSQNIMICGNDLTWHHIGPDETTESGAYTRGAGGSASGAPNYTQSFSGQTSVVLTHGLGTDNLIVQCHAADDTILGPDTITYARSTPFDATVTFTTAETGRCIVNGLMNAGRFSSGFVSVTTHTILGSAHGLGSQFLNVSCYDTATPIVQVYPANITIAAVSFDVVITFKVAETGTCVVQ